MILLALVVTNDDDEFPFVADTSNDNKIKVTIDDNNNNILNDDDNLGAFNNKVFILRFTGLIGKGKYDVTFFVMLDFLVGLLVSVRSSHRILSTVYIFIQFLFKC